MAFARHQFELSQPQDDGTPLLAHLEAAWRATGKQPEMLANAPDLPAGYVGLWQDFLSLHACRGSTGWGAQRITFADMQAYQAIARCTLSPRAVELITRADNLWLAEFAPKPKEGK